MGRDSVVHVHNESQSVIIWYTKDMGEEYHERVTYTLRGLQKVKLTPKDIVKYGDEKSKLLFCEATAVVIYLGNHLFSDLRGPSKAGWRTTAIIHDFKNDQVGFVSLALENDSNGSILRSLLSSFTSNLCTGKLFDVLML
ncbi:hypothetical protein Tco_0833537 [Tanacetum coccineum]